MPTAATLNGGLCRLSACLPTAADCPNIEWRLRYVALLLAALSGQWSRLSVTEPPLAALSIRNARGKIVYSWDAASLSVGSSDRIEGCIGPAIRLSYACAVAD